MAEIPQTFAPDRPMPPPVMGGLPDDASLSPAAQEADRVGAEQLIRTTLQQLANGIPIKDSNEVVRQAVGKISPADIRAGHISPSALGEIIAAVETAKSGGAHFDWRMATPDQIRDYAFKHGLDLSRFGLGHGPLSHTGDAGGSGARADSGSGSQAQSNGRYGGLFGSETSIPMAQALAKAMGLPSRDWLPYENPAKLAGIKTPGEWSQTPLARVDHINFNTFKGYLQPWGFKGSEIHQGVKDTEGILGIGPKEQFNPNTPIGAALVRDTAGLHKEAPKEAPHIVAAVKHDREMLEHDKKYQGAIDHAADELKSGTPTEAAKDKAADEIARNLGRVYKDSGAKAQVENPALNDGARAFAGDAAYQAQKFQLGKDLHARGFSQPAIDDLSQRALDRTRLMYGGPSPMPGPTPATGPGMAPRSPEAPKAGFGRPQDHPRMSSLTPEQVAANARRDEGRRNVAQQQDGNGRRDAQTGQRDTRTASNNAEQSNQFAALLGGASLGGVLKSGEPKASGATPTGGPMRVAANFAPGTTPAAGIKSQPAAPAPSTGNTAPSVVAANTPAKPASPPAQGANTPAPAGAPQQTATPPANQTAALQKPAIGQAPKIG